MKTLIFCTAYAGPRPERYGEYLDHIPRDADWSMQTPRQPEGAARGVLLVVAEDRATRE